MYKKNADAIPTNPAIPATNNALTGKESVMKKSYMHIDLRPLAAAKQTAQEAIVHEKCKAVHKLSYAAATGVFEQELWLPCDVCGEQYLEEGAGHTCDKCKKAAQKAAAKAAPEPTFGDDEIPF